MKSTEVPLSPLLAQEQVAIASLATQTPFLQLKESIAAKRDALAIRASLMYLEFEMTENAKSDMEDWLRQAREMDICLRILDAEIASGQFVKPIRITA